MSVSEMTAVQVSAVLLCRSLLWGKKKKKYLISQSQLDTFKTVDMVKMTWWSSRWASKWLKKKGGESDLSAFQHGMDVGARVFQKVLIYCDFFFFFSHTDVTSVFRLAKNRKVFNSFLFIQLQSHLKVLYIVR